MTGDNVLFWELVPLRHKKHFKPHPKTGSWYLLGIVFKISDKHPRPYYMGVSPSGRNYARKSVTHEKQQTKAIAPDNFITVQNSYHQLS